MAAGQSLVTFHGSGGAVTGKSLKNQVQILYGQVNYQLRHSMTTRRHPPLSTSINIHMSKFYLGSQHTNNCDDAAVLSLGHGYSNRFLCDDDDNTAAIHPKMRVYLHTRFSSSVADWSVFLPHLTIVHDLISPLLNGECGARIFSFSPP